MIKVMVVDDHPLIREGMSLMFDKCATDMEVICQASSAAEALKILLEKKPDIILMDISLPDRNGIDLIKDVHKMHPNLPVLVLTIHPEERFAIRALKAGASGYLSKVVGSQELFQAVRTIVKDKKKYISPAVAEELAKKLTHAGDKMPHELLSDREYEVFYSLVKGKKVSEIAEDLSLSVQTIHTYHARIKDKMKIDSKTQLIWYALEHNLID